MTLRSKFTAAVFGLTSLVTVAAELPNYPYQGITAVAKEEFTHRKTGKVYAKYGYDTDGKNGIDVTIWRQICSGVVRQPAYAKLVEKAEGIFDYKEIIVRPDRRGVFSWTDMQPPAGYNPVEEPSPPDCSIRDL